jgi:hypothetical protein
MIQYLVMVNNKNLPIEIRYDYRYRVYNDFDVAVAWAVENGYENMFPVNEKVGILNSVQCGDREVSIMAVQAI